MNKELLTRARDYVTSLANGINPLNGETLPETDITNNIKISRCLFYVSTILDDVITNTKVIKEPFKISRENLEKFEYSNEGISVTEITARINSLIDTNVMQALKVTDITRWFESIGFLTKTTIDNRAQKMPTNLGREMGLFTESRQGLYRNYEAVLYKRKMQEFIIDNFESLIEFKNSNNKRKL